jgi:hypothetical protein
VSRTANPFARRVLLIECLDAAGAILEDAAARARALEPVAAAVETLELRFGTKDVPATRTPQPRAARAAIDDAIATFDPGLVIVATAESGGGAVGRMIGGGVDALWWPTAVGAAAARPRGWAGLRPRAHGPLVALAGVEDVPESSFRATPALASSGASALDWAVQDAEVRGGSRLPLWDGRYLLAPVPLLGRAGHDLLRTFAELEARWDRVDLVILGAVDPEFQSVARRLGIGARVHFAGAATSEAELTWLRAAAGVVFGHHGPVSAALVLRALACGAPVLAAGTPLAVTVHEWLAARGLIPASWASDALPLRTKLEHLLEHDRAVEDAVKRGRAVAVRHQPDALSKRLAVALGWEPRSRAA